MMKTDRLRKVTSAAVAAALILCATSMMRIPVPVSGGAYVNFGDAVIFLCTYIIGAPLGAAAAAAGSGLADLLVGAPLYILPTMGIKAVMALTAGYLMRRQTLRAYIGGCLAGGAVMAGGYFLFEMLLLGGTAAFLSLPFNLLQAGGSILAAVLLYEPGRRLAREINKRGAHQ